MFRPALVIILLLTTYSVPCHATGIDIMRVLNWIKNSSSIDTQLLHLRPQGATHFQYTLLQREIHGALEAGGVGRFTRDLDFSTATGLALRGTEDALERSRLRIAERIFANERIASSRRSFLFDIAYQGGDKVPVEGLRKLGIKTKNLEQTWETLTDTQNLLHAKLNRIESGILSGSALSASGENLLRSLGRSGATLQALSDTLFDVAWLFNNAATRSRLSSEQVVALSRWLKEAEGILEETRILTRWLNEKPQILGDLLRDDNLLVSWRIDEARELRALLPDSISLEISKYFDDFASSAKTIGEASELAILAKTDDLLRRLDLKTNRLLLGTNRYPQPLQDAISGILISTNSRRTLVKEEITTLLWRARGETKDPAWTSTFSNFDNVIEEALLHRATAATLSENLTRGRAILVYLWTKPLEESYRFINALSLRLEMMELLLTRI